MNNQELKSKAQKMSVKTEGFEVWFEHTTASEYRINEFMFWCDGDEGAYRDTLCIAVNVLGDTIDHIMPLYDEDIDWGSTGFNFFKHPVKRFTSGLFDPEEEYTDIQEYMLHLQTYIKLHHYHSSGTDFGKQEPEPEVAERLSYTTLFIAHDRDQIFLVDEKEGMASQINTFLSWDPIKEVEDSNGVVFLLDDPSW